ncbi:MAG: hypothetical protein PUC12_04035, partial [Clostridiales bacterium]|nr:hypothetical protein [Clostridiales bacterium]
LLPTIGKDLITMNLTEHYLIPSGRIKKTTNKELHGILANVLDVRHRAGVNDDNEPCVGWWLEWNEHKRSCPVYSFHVTHESEYPYLKEGYELISLN